MPQMHFHVAAITEMSSKLMSAGQYDNVSLYPNEMCIRDRASSGVEYAQSYRANLLRRAHIPARFVFTDMFPTENIEPVSYTHLLCEPGG